LSDEKIVSQLQATLTKTECPVSRRAFSIWRRFLERACPARNAGWIPVRVKKNASKVERQDKEPKDRDNSGS
jgi:hypothetical protein